MDTAQAKSESMRVRFKLQRPSNLSDAYLERSRPVSDRTYLPSRLPQQRPSNQLLVAQMI